MLSSSLRKPKPLDALETVVEKADSIISEANAFLQARLKDIADSLLEFITPLEELIDDTERLREAGVSEDLLDFAAALQTGSLTASDFEDELSQRLRDRLGLDEDLLGGAFTPGQAAGARR